MGSLFLIMLLSCAPKPPPSTAPPMTEAQDAAAGRIGTRFVHLPEGLLIEEVQANMGAMDAGLQPGDLITAVDGVPTEGRTAADIRAAIIGPADSTVTLVVQAPLSQQARTVEVQRRVPPDTLPARRRPRPRPPEAVQTLNHALRHGDVQEVTAAASALLSADLDGQTIGEATSGGLRLAAQENPDNATAALTALRDAGKDDWMFQRTRGEVLHIMGQDAAAATSFENANALRPPDHQSLSGVRSDLGGDPRGRKMWIEAAWGAGRHQQAVAQGRALLRTGVNSPSLLGLLGMAPLDAGEIWTAPLPTMPDFSAPLLDGDSWILSDQQGRVVVMTFWATWCGPCRKELPELEALWQRRSSEPVSFVAISTDDPADTDQVRAKVQELGLTFPVTHQPSLGAEYNVSGIPAIRVLNRSGALHYAAKGYSPSSVERLDEQITAALEQTGNEAPLGSAWSVDHSARLRQFVPIMGASSIWHGGTRTVVGREDAAPMVFDAGLPERVEVDIDSADPLTADRLTWADGAVAATSGGRLLRAWNPDGTPRWMQTTRAPIVDIAAAGNHVWVATREQVHVLRLDGSLVESMDLVVHDLAEDSDGVWAVGDNHRWWLQPDHAPVERGSTPDGALVDSHGGVATAIAADLVAGRFGPEGAIRAVSVRTDNTIIATDGHGQVAFTWAVPHPVRVAAGDTNGDGLDELLVSISRQGVAVVELHLP